MEVEAQEELVFLFRISISRPGPGLCPFTLMEFIDGVCLNDICMETDLG